MSSAPARRLAVLGSPITHSKSPDLQLAAYRVLGLDWQYSAIEVTEDTLTDFIESRDDAWRGLSLTMPLKRDILPLLDRRDLLVQTTGSANTVLFRGDGNKRYLHGFNTDVFGITEALSRRGYSKLGIVQILGGGATAASAIVAVGQLGAHTVHVSVRNPDRAVGLLDVGKAAGVSVIIGSVADAPTAAKRPDAVISTLPNGVESGIAFSEETRASAVLLDVAYHPWPTAFAAEWTAVGGSVIGGLDMLVLQALAQVRIFVGGNQKSALDREPAVLTAMFAAVGL